MASARRGDGSGLSPVKFSRLASRGVLLGLSGLRLAVLAAGGVVAVAALYAGGGKGVAYTAPIWVAALALVWLPAGGRRLVEWGPVAVDWTRRTLGGQTMFKKNPDKPRPAGTLALPGAAAALRQHTDAATGAVMVHDPHTATLTGIVEIAHPSFMLLDPSDQERRVAAWGRVLATCCRSGRIARVQVLERTLPDEGTGLADWWRAHGTPDGSWTSRVYEDLIGRAGPASERHATTISVALDLKAAHRAVKSAGGGMGGAAAVLGQELDTLTTALRAADLAPAKRLDAADLAVILRAAYDPAAAAGLERHRDTGRDLAAAGPVAVRESWASMRTDSAWHAVLWISEWPRAQVYPGFLAHLLLASGARRAFSLTATPMRADQAAKDIRRKKVEYVSDKAQRARIGQIEDASQHAEYQDVLQQEADLTAGHGIVRYTGLIAVTADTEDDLAAAVAAVEQGAIQASCETRVLAAQQAHAFTAAALPLCRPI
ncbi:MAG: PrgI family protein [Bifidobacteriaceae bacterium]|jgi:hypothetical protein|nr:PrgI family protein [Bifidobacteriaceae bacterium]